MAHPMKGVAQQRGHGGGRVPANPSSKSRRSPRPRLRAIRPEAIALGVFAFIAGLAILLITGQAIGRQLRLRADDLSVLRALGTSPSLIAAEGLIGIGASM